MIRILFVFVSLLLGNSIFSQALYQVENAEKGRYSSLIVEGEVVEKTSYWNVAHTMIYTSNKIKVYKVFKGNVLSDYIEVVTTGGAVEDDAIVVSDLLELGLHEIGIFFCYPNNQNLQSVSGDALYDVYASSQGFIKYNVEGNKAADPFNRFSSITQVLYPLVEGLSGKRLQIKDGSFKIKDDRGLLRSTAAVINSFFPQTVNAGATSDPTNNQLTITGTGFGMPGGSAAVKFSDANAGVGSDIYWTVSSTSNLIVSWTDTEIKVRVPSRAGSGSVKVVDAAGVESLASFDILNVFYSILTFVRGGVEKQLNLINANGQGGYTMLYSATMTPDATATYNRALKTWVDLSGFNVKDGGSTEISRAMQDGASVVFLDNDANGAPLPAGVLAAAYSYADVCSPSANFLFRRPEFDVIIRSAYSTGTTSFANGPCPPGTNTVDLETVLLHEIGHALNLGHINDAPEGSGTTRNPQKLMYFAVSNGVKRTSPDASAYQGSLYTCASNPTLNFGPCTAITAHQQLPLIRDAKDECPLIFPSSPTQQGTQVTFDLAHATSNSFRDPQYTNVLCNSNGTNVTNNLYYVLKTDASGSLTINVSDFTIYTEEAAACAGTGGPAGRLGFYKVTSCPVGQDFPAVMNCQLITGNGVLPIISGLTGNTNYLMYVDGRLNSKVSFKLTLGGSTLPIKLESFSGEMKGPINEIKWKISSYADVNKVVLERSSNGREFTPIKPYGNVFDLAKEYFYSDTHPYAGSNYYRLATYNKDGSVQYSKVILLERKEKIKFNIFPNPVADNIKISITAVEDLGSVQLKLFNLVGQLLLMKTSKVTNGTTNLEVKAGSLSAGLYRLVISDKNNTILVSRNFQKL